MSKQPDDHAHRDRTGIWIAALCFLHCVAGPVLLSVAGLASLTGISERFEPVFLLGSLVMGTITLIPGYRKKHGRMSCLAMFVSGILCLILRHQVRLTALPFEHIGAAIGATLVIGAHALNLKYSRRCRCCEAAAPVSLPSPRATWDSTTQHRPPLD